MSANTTNSLNSLNKMSHYNVGTRPPMGSASGKRKQEKIKSKPAQTSAPFMGDALRSFSSSATTRGGNSRFSMGFFDVFAIGLIVGAFFLDPLLGGVVGAGYLFSWIRSL